MGGRTIRVDNGHGHRCRDGCSYTYHVPPPMYTPLMPRVDNGHGHGLRLGHRLRLRLRLGGGARLRYDHTRHESQRALEISVVHHCQNHGFGLGLGLDSG